MNKLWAAMIVPVVGIFGAATSVYADSTLVTVNVSDTSLELDVPASPTILTLNPTASGANFGSIDLTATVGTNNPTGYQLSVTFSNTALSRTVAVDGTTPTISTLDTLAGGYPVADFTVNRWGHKITGDNYFPVPSSTLSPESWSSDEPVNNAQNVITLAAKADGTIPSGIYETTLTYMLVANMVTNITFDDAFSAAGKTKDATIDKYKMHEMTSSICEMVTTDQIGELVDIRDGTVYHVGKLKDDRCWLLDNLALDPTLSAVKANMSDANTNASAVAIANYKNGGNSGNNDGWATEAVSYETSSNAYAQPRINVDSKDLTRSDLTDPSDPLVEANGWKFGVYYNFCAASVGTFCYNSGSLWDADPFSAFDVKNDICPANWRMPTGGDISSAGTTAGGGEYQSLAKAITGNTSSFSGEPAYTNFRKSLHLPLSGSFSAGSAGQQGNHSPFYSSTYKSRYNIGVLFIDTSNIYPQGGGGPYGVPVRCIAKNGTEPGEYVDPDPNTTTFDEAYSAAHKSKDIASDKYTMQTMSSSVCNAVTTDQIGELVDTRDGNVYRVGKLKDGHCWLLDNLALDLTDSATLGALSSVTNTNSSYLGYLDGTIARDPSDNPDGGDATTSVSSWISDYSFSAPLVNTASKNLTNASDPLDATKNSKYGIYYNYCAASTGRYCYGNYHSNGVSYDKPNTLVDAKDDICPINWRMPTGSASGEYQALYSAYGSNITDFRTALLAPLSGFYDGNSVNYQGSNGYFWSSTKFDDGTMYGLYIYSENAFPSDFYGRDLGFPVRCIAKY